MKKLHLWMALFACCAGLHGAHADVTVTVKNPANIARASETIDLKWSDLSPLLGKVKPDHVIVIDSDQKGVVAQPVFLHGKKKPADGFIFQADFAPNQTRVFTIKPGAPALYDPRVYGRWVPERQDDFGWENDRIAYRMYGPALEKVEPGSSGVDVWPKRTRNLIINKWYQMAQSINDGYYHADRGEGLDCYKVDHAQGCGGTAIWSDGKRFTTGTKGWRTEKVLANGPIRLVFELTYDAIDAGGTSITETKRVTLDAGQNLNHFQSTFKADKPDADLTIAVGVMEHPDRPGEKAMHKDQGWMTYWDAGDASVLTKDNGHVGCAFVADPVKVKDMVEVDDHLLALMPVDGDGAVNYWAGAGWDRSGDFDSLAAWNDYVQQWSARLQSPLQVSVSK